MADRHNMISPHPVVSRNCTGFARNSLDMRIERLPLQLLTTAFAAFLVSGASWSDQSPADTHEGKAHQITIAEFLDSAERHTGYIIILSGEVSEEKVARSKGSVDVNNAVAHLLRELKFPNHVAVVDREKKRVKITIIGEASPALSVESPPLSVDQWATPADISVEELALIKSDYLDSRSSDLYSAEISPPSEYGPGFNHAEFDGLKTEYAASKELDGGAAVSPPSEEGDGLSAYEFADIKSAYLMRERDVFRQISPASEFGPGLTVDELNDLKLEYFSSIDPPVRKENLQSD